MIFMHGFHEIHILKKKTSSIENLGIVVGFDVGFLIVRRGLSVFINLHSFNLYLAFIFAIPAKKKKNLSI